MKRGIPGIYQNGTYLTNNPTWHVEDSQEKAAWIIRLLERNRIKPSTICEVGCGAGGILSQLSEKLNEEVTFYGYELSPQAFQLCRDRQKENLHFYCKDILEEEKYFDLLLIIDVVEHVEDYLGFLAGLKDKGRHKIFRIPLNISVQSVLCKSSPILKARRDFGHLHYFTKETAFATLEYANYRIIDYFYTYGPVSLQQIGLMKYFPKLLKKTLFTLNREWFSRLFDGFSVIILAE